jgi:hypothetical protein
MHIEDLSWDSVDRICHGASWVSNPFKVRSRLPEHLLSIPLIGFGLDTLLIAVHPTVDCTRLVNCSRVGNLVAFILGTYKGDYGGIPWYLEQTSGHALQSIPRGCFRVRVALALVSCSSVG